MTPQEIIDRVRTHFGEREALTLQDEELREWMDQAVRELILDLPAHELRDIAEVRSLGDGLDEVVGLDGTYEIPDDVYHVTSVYQDEYSPMRRVSPQVINQIDEGGGYFTPAVPCFAHAADRLLVRPVEQGGYAEVLVEPPLLTAGDMDNELDTVPAVWHPAIVLKLTSYAYAQEEDQPQAQFYEQAYEKSIGRGPSPFDLHGHHAVQAVIDQGHRRRQRGQQ